MKKIQYLTADEVRALPDGTRVIIHSHDRHGYSTQTAAEVVSVTERSKQLLVRGWDGLAEGKRIDRKPYHYSLAE